MSKGELIFVLSLVLVKTVASIYKIVDFGITNQGLQTQMANLTQAMRMLKTNTTEYEKDLLDSIDLACAKDPEAKHCLTFKSK